MKHILPKGLPTNKPTMKVHPLKQSRNQPMHSQKYYKKPAHLTQVHKEARAAQARIVGHGTQAAGWNKIEPVPKQRLNRLLKSKMFKKLRPANSATVKIKKLFGGLSDANKRKC